MRFRFVTPVMTRGYLKATARPPQTNLESWTQKLAHASGLQSLGWPDVVTPSNQGLRGVAGTQSCLLNVTDLRD